MFNIRLQQNAIVNEAYSTKKFNVIGKSKVFRLYSNIYPTRCNIPQFILSGNCSTCFRWYHHPSSGAQTTVSTASGICHTVIVICRYRGRVGTGLSVLWVAYATHSTFKLGATGPDVGAARLLIAPGDGGLDAIYEPELKIRSGLRRP